MRFAWASIGAILVGSIISNSQTDARPRAKEFTLEELQTTEQRNPLHASNFGILPDQDKRVFCGGRFQGAHSSLKLGLLITLVYTLLTPTYTLLPQFYTWVTLLFTPLTLLYTLFTQLYILLTLLFYNTKATGDTNNITIGHIFCDLHAHLHLFHLIPMQLSQIYVIYFFFSVSVCTL